MVSFAGFSTVQYKPRDQDVPFQLVHPTGAINELDGNVYDWIMVVSGSVYLYAGLRLHYGGPYGDPLFGITSQKESSGPGYAIPASTSEAVVFTSSAITSGSTILDWAELNFMGQAAISGETIYAAWRLNDNQGNSYMLDYCALGEANHIMRGVMLNIGDTLSLIVNNSNTASVALFYSMRIR